MRRVGFAFVLVLCTTDLAISAPVAQLGLQRDVVFTEYFPLSSNVELARRLLTPLTAARVPQILAHAGEALRTQPIDLSQEKFVVYVPSTAPAKGYGVLVFVPPWDNARLPDGWGDVLDQFGFIFVSAEQSGNDENAVGRREPLALLAEQNVARRYPVNPERVFIAGFSGGSRVALRIAVAYPDIFRGAMLNAGSDPIGGGALHVPPRDLFFRFQETTHLFYVTGERDTTALAADAGSKRSMDDWCMFNVDDSSPDTVHVVAGPSALSRALGALLAPAMPDPARLAACRSGIDAELTAQLDKAESLVAEGKREDASDLLKTIDARFGGLAAPRSIELEHKLE